MTQAQTDDITEKLSQSHIITCHDMTKHNATPLQVLPDLLLLVSCYCQAACPEMFSEEELSCIAVALDEKKKLLKRK